MSGKNCVVAVVAGTIVLVVWTGLTQVFLWGTGSVHNLSAGEAGNIVVAWLLALVVIDRLLLGKRSSGARPRMACKIERV